VANYGANNLDGFLGQANGIFVTMILFPMDYESRPLFVVVGDFHNDIKLDFAVANISTASLTDFLILYLEHYFSPIVYLIYVLIFSSFIR
jgi:hypothetical protein